MDAERSYKKPTYLLNRDDISDLATALEKLKYKPSHFPYAQERIALVNNFVEALVSRVTYESTLDQHKFEKIRTGLANLEVQRLFDLHGGSYHENRRIAQKAASMSDSLFYSYLLSQPDYIDADGQIDINRFSFTKETLKKDFAQALMQKNLSVDVDAEMTKFTQALDAQDLLHVASQAQGVFDTLVAGKTKPGLRPL